MKKIILFIVVAAVLFLAPTVNAQVQISKDFAGYIIGTKGLVGGNVPGSASAGYLDTLVNTDTTYYTVSIKGAKSNITFQVDALKISGTVAGTIKIFGSANGTTYETAVATTATTITDASVNYVVSFTSNKYQKYQVQVIGSGTNNFSNRMYLLYRQ